MIERNDPCWCGSNKKWKKCHYPFEGKKNEKQDLSSQYLKQYGIILKTPEQIEKIKKACKITAQILDKLCKKAVAGVTTNDLNRYAEQLHKEAGVIAAPLHYGSPPFPKSICTSLNDVICHGIPNDIPLQEGDILNIDISCILDGYYGDCSRMITIGTIEEEKERVVDVARECLRRSIEILKPSILLSKIGEVIEDYATSKNCSVVYQFVGHGVGVKFHEPPQIMHCYNRMHIPLVAGMTFTIEPMINAGVPDAIIDPKNQWEAHTKDGKASAQEEHTVLITDEGYEVLTLLTE